MALNNFHTKWCMSTAPFADTVGIQTTDLFPTLEQLVQNFAGVTFVFPLPSYSNHSALTSYGTSVLRLPKALDRAEWTHQPDQKEAAIRDRLANVLNCMPSGGGSTPGRGRTNNLSVSPSQHLSRLVSTRFAFLYTHALSELLCVVKCPCPPFGKSKPNDQWCEDTHNHTFYFFIFFSALLVVY